MLVVEHFPVSLSNFISVLVICDVANYLPRLARWRR